MISRSIRSADGNAAHAATTDSRDYSHNNNHHHLAISVHSNQSSGNSGRGGAGGGLNSLNLSTDSSKVNSSQSLQAGAILGLDSFVLREPAGVLAPIRKYLVSYAPRTYSASAFQA